MVALTSLSLVIENETAVLNSVKRTLVDPTAIT